MARIRSIHPSIFTDEAWVSCSPLARVLYIGLLTDADDQGLFEWKALQIKMRLLPGDNIDVVLLLDELVQAALIQALDAGGKRLGAIRYFCKFQRPKKPTYRFPLPDSLRTYVGMDDADGEPQTDDGGDVPSMAVTASPPVPHSDPPASEIGPQMEDGGRNRRRERLPQKPPRGAFSPAFIAAFEAFPVEGTATSSQTRCWPPWETLAAEVGEDRLAAAVDAFVASPAVVGPKAKAAPKFHVWLEDRRFERFLPRANARWPGPVEIRAEVIAAIGEHGEAFASAFLDARCGWQDMPVRAVTCPTSWLREKLSVSPAGAVFAARGIAILRQEALTA